MLVEQESKWTLINEDTPFAVVISVCDPRVEQGIDIYSSIQSEVPNRYRDLIEIQERIRI